MFSKGYGYVGPRGGFRKDVTSFDVAKRAGVSRASVSRAFSPDGNISPELKERIHRAASELGYRVNQMARGLNRQRSDLVGLIVARLEDPAQTALLQQLNRQMIDAGLRPMLTTVDNAGVGSVHLQPLLDFQVSGVVIAAPLPSPALARECAMRKVPLVLLNRGETHSHVDKVSSDAKAAGVLAAQTLLDLGRTSLCAIAPTDAVSPLNQRARAFETAAAQNGADVRRLPLDATGYEAGRHAAAALMKLSPLPNGIFVPSDSTAIGCLHGLRALGVRVPEDSALIGFDDIPQAAWSTIGLSTFRTDAHAIAKAAIELMNNRISKPESAAAAKTVDITFVRRDTA